MICRHNSEPIDPPAPVTMTTFPNRYWAMSFFSPTFSSRPKMSSGSTFLIASILTLPSRISKREGTFFTSAPAISHWVTIFLILSLFIEGMAIMIVSIPLCLTTWPTLEIFPSTGMWWIIIPIFLGSSSRKPTGRYGRFLFRSISRTRPSPASPAPTMRTFFVSLAKPVFFQKCIVWMDTLIPPTKTVARIICIKITDLGKVHCWTKYKATI